MHTLFPKAARRSLQIHAMYVSPCTDSVLKLPLAISPGNVTTCALATLKFRPKYFGKQNSHQAVGAEHIRDHYLPRADGRIDEFGRQQFAII